MANLQSLVDHIYYNSARKYNRVEGDVAYLDGSALTRPFAMPKVQRVIAAVIVVAAVVIGALFLNNTVFAGLREQATAEQYTKNNLAREASIETIPKMASLINMEDDDIRMALAEAGYTVYDASDSGSEASLVLYKLPDDMTVEEAAPLYAKGIGNLTSVQASKLLNGSWYLSADRNGGLTMVVRYADFSTGDPERAVKNAMDKEGLTVDDVSDSGVDEIGNTYSMGALDADGTQCTWKVSALPLSDMYSVSGLPDDACYVGVRITAQ